jgi:biopolymer transport protein ExbB
MIPLGLCSMLALGWIMERALRMRRRTLGSRAQAEQLSSAAREGGPGKALELARANPTVLSKIFQPVFERWEENRPTLEKAVEDSGSRELRVLVSALRPLTVITVSAPLLGLFGTVVGIIIAFRDIALSNAMGKPEALATGIGQALVTTAAGMAIANPTQASYYWFRAKIDRFWSLVEETGEQIFAVQAGRSARHAISSPPAPPTLSPSSSAVDQGPFVAQGAP